MSKFDSFTNLLHLALQFVELGKAKGLEEKLTKAAQLAEQGKFDQIKILVADITGKGYADENLHSRTVRLLQPEDRERYKGYLAQYREQNAKGHVALILCLATETEEKERLAKITELAQSDSYDSFVRTIKAYKYDEPQTEVQKKLQKFVNAVSIGLSKVGDGAKIAGQGIGSVAKDLSAATGNAFDGLETDAAQTLDSSADFRRRMREKYQSNK